MARHGRLFARTSGAYDRNIAWKKISSNLNQKLRPDGDTASDSERSASDEPAEVALLLVIWSLLLLSLLLCEWQPGELSAAIVCAFMISSLLHPFHGSNQQK